MNDLTAAILVRLTRNISGVAKLICGLQLVTYGIFFIAFAWLYITVHQANVDLGLIGKVAIAVLFVISQMGLGYWWLQYQVLDLYEDMEKSFKETNLELALGGLEWA